MSAVTEVPDSNKVFRDDVFEEDNKHIADEWRRIGEVYPTGANMPLLPETFSREQFGQGTHYECFMLSTLSTLVHFPDIIRNCFVTKKIRQDGRYTFQFFRGEEWVKVEIDDTIAMEQDDVLYTRSPTEHWWPLLLEKAYAKFYTTYDHLEGCTLQETFHDLTGYPVLNIPMDAKLAKAAGADVTEGAYWLGLAQKIQTGQFVASVLTKDMDVENMGLQREQQYGVLEIFSLTGTSSVNDIVIHLHNPFEDDEFLYKGPLNSKDATWTPKLRAKYDIDDPRSIFLPLNTFLKIMNSVQLCYMSQVESDATYYHDEWRGETAGGNPTSVTWRKNPLYYVRNSGSTPADIVMVIKQEDQRRFTSPDEMSKYLQCGMVLIHYTYPNPIPTFYVTGNNHKPIHKSLFLNSREVANAMTIPANSLCYLVPSCMLKGAEGEFTIALYRMKDADYSDVTIKKLDLPEMNWKDPATKSVSLRQKEKDRVDFYVDEETDIHILLHQTKPYVSKNGGDAMTEDYMGMYLYDDTDHKIGGVHAATNFREVSIIHHLPRSGRFAISVTCPRAKAEVPADITIVGSYPSNVRIVDAPEDATMFDDDDEQIDEGDDADLVRNPIDYFPIHFDVTAHQEGPDSNSPYEDKRFMMDNRNVSSEPWIHIGDLYPEGKSQPLLPQVLSRDQFEQGEHFECCCLTGFATLVDHHPEVVRNCFISKKPRKDGRYTFQFHRYGQWVKVEIDDRIPLVDGNTLYCRSPTRHWWPLLLEKAYAKFYTLYQNLEGCTMQEVFHDFTGRPVISIPTDPELAKAALCDIEEPDYWMMLDRELERTAIAGLTKMDKAEPYGMQDDQSYGILGFIPMKNAVDLQLSDILVKIFNPFEDCTYRGPMCNDDPRWPSDLRQICTPEKKNLIYMPADAFCDVFLNMQQAYIKGPLEPCWNFNSEWGEGTNGGNPTLVTWRENPLYVVRNDQEEPVQIIGMIRQPDQRHTLHRQTNQELNYIQCGLILAESTTRNSIPTYLVTGNNHRTVHKGLFLNSREVANIITIPAESLCYLVPSAMFRDKGKFILSYWFENQADERNLKIVRLNVDVARQLPAIDHVELRNKEKDRVDFLVDVPTDVHILLRQEKPFKTPNGGDAMAEDFLAMYLYDSGDRRISGTTSATNYREIGLVHHVDSPGRYALSITCPRGTGKVPCRVEVVALENAHVRITDPPENARELGEVDLSFIDAEPEGVLVADLPLDTDPEFQRLREELKRQHEDPEGNAGTIAALERKMNERAHDLAKGVIGKDRAKYLPNHDLDKLNPLLNADNNYMEAERDRYVLKKDPRNAAKVRSVEEELRGLADDIADVTKTNNLDFLDPEYEGIPTADIEVMNDPEFANMMQDRAQLMRDPATNARNINDLEDEMHDRARELARAMHAKERRYLNPAPEGIPLDLLPLNEDPLFSQMEDELRALNRKPKRDVQAIKALEDKLEARAHELAAKLKNDERELFLDPAPLGVPIADLPLDTDPQFHNMEIERLQKRKEDPLGNKDRIKALEAALNNRANELARQRLNDLRGFLDPEPYGIPLEKLGLDYNDPYVRMEDELRALMKAPKQNADKIAALQNKMRDHVNGLAAAEAARDRQFLDPEPEGRLVQSLPLDEDAQFADLDKRRRQMKYKGGDPEKMRDMEEKMNEIAHDIAHALNVAERPDYLEPTFRGIPFADLPLDEDQQFRALEAKRQVLKRDPKRNARTIADVEQELNHRAAELAEAKVASDRGYLDPEPDGVPLRLLPLDRDAAFTDMEGKRAALKKDPKRNAKAIAELEGALNARARELAHNLKEAERARFLEPKPHGIPYQDLPLDTDQTFRDLEIQRLLMKENPQKNATAIQDLEDALNDRAAELADQVRRDGRAFLDPAPLGVPLEELPLDMNKAFLAKEDELRKLRKNPQKNAAAIQKLEDELNDMARAIAAEELAKQRGFLDPEPEGRLLEELPLNTDPEFRKMEAEYRELKKDPKKNNQKLADLEELMNDRAHKLAQMMNAAERPKYLRPNPKGIPLDQLPLDTDEEFRTLEAQRARLNRQPAKNKAAIKDIEDALNLRAEELAQERIAADRAFMGTAVEGVPVKYLPLDQDKDFQKMEAERTALKAKGIRANDPRIRELEDDMTERAKEVAKAMKEDVRASVLPQRAAGVERGALQLDQDMPFTDLENAYIKARGDGEDPEKAQDLADAMAKRAADVADERRAEERARLGSPLGYAVEELGLDQNPEYRNKEAELIALRANPKANAQRIADAEEELADIAMGMARDKAAEDRSFLPDEIEGRRATELPYETDPTFTNLEEQYHRAKRDPYADNEHLNNLEQMMQERAAELARQKNAAERPDFMDTAPRNVPLSELPLDTDDEFLRLEAERAHLRQDPRKNAHEIRDVEDAMNARADQLAAEALKNDRMFVEDKPNNVALRHIPIDEDPLFQQLEQQRAAIKAQGSGRSDKAVRDLEDAINERVRALADQVHQDTRKDMEPSFLGIPRTDLDPHLDADEHFQQLEEMYRDAKKDPAKGKVAAQILDQMNDRAKEIAQAVHEAERAPLEQNPEGMPLNALPLNDDDVFNALESEARALRNAPNGERKNAARLAEIEKALNDRAAELANESRKAYCDSAPEGVPLELLRLGEDPEFTRKEAELRRLQKNPIANREAISDLEYDLNARAHEKAKDLLQGDRAYLDQKPEGVDIAYVPIDSDEAFRAMEAERARLKAEDPRRNQKAIADLEDQLNNRAHELARELKNDEVRSLDADRVGVPYDIVAPHQDEQFAELADQLRELKQDPKRNASAIRDVKERMNERGAELASQMLQGNRAYLEREPEGVPLQYLPLDSDPQFHKLEVERAKLAARDGARNPKKLQELEDQLNARAHELAQEQKREDLRGLDQKPEDIPLSIIDPHSDPVFASFLPTLRALKEDPTANKQQIADVLADMNDRCHQLASEMVRGERPGYLEPNPSGVPLDMLPLDSDPAFHDMEVQRAILKAQDPRRNANKIKDLEDRLNERAHELAEIEKQHDLDNLDQQPEGIPLAVVNPHRDPTFAELAEQHRNLRRDPQANAEQLAALEDQMNARAHELAQAMLQGDRAYLDMEPQGVPIQVLPLDEDEVFRALEAERAKLKAQDPRRNARKIGELEQQLNNRAHELARAQKEEDLRGVDPAPRDVPLELLKPHEDPQFAKLIEEARAIKSDPRATQAQLQAVVDAMNARADEMAAEAMDRGYLRPDPLGVPLDVLPLDTDPQFHQMEVERAKLKLKDPRRNAKRIAELEAQLNDRAEELARKQLQEDMSGCDPAPEGIPLALIKPTEDEKFASMIPQLRALKQDPVKNADAIHNLENEMNNRAYELADAMLEGDRGYLDTKPAGVPLEYLPLHQDKTFGTMEIERAKLKAQDPRRNARRIQELEGQLNDRARELGEQKKKEELALFAPSYGGIETAALRPHDDPEFAAMVDQLRKMEMEGSANSPAGQKLLEDMEKRLQELAKEKTDGDLWFLDKEPEGIAIEEVHVERDPKFAALQKERANLKTKDSRGNADRIKSIEEELNNRARELANELKESDFDGVDQNPCGIPLELLKPRDDPLIARLLPELRRAKDDPRGADKVRDLLGQINDRVHQLAEEALQGERPTYLDTDPEGVPLHDLPLESDGIYKGLELERAKLKLQDPVKNAKQIEELEERLNERAHELAQEVLKDDLRPLDSAPENVPLEAIKPHENPDFNELAKYARALRADPKRNADKLRDVEDQMNQLAHDMAREMLANDRDYLDPNPEGVPATVLPLDTDPEFHDLEVKRAILKAQDPKKNQAQIADLEERLNERARELAEEQKREDLRGLNPAPQGVPVELLNPHDDPRFAALLPELRRLKEDASSLRNKERLNDVQAKLDGILNDLAAEYLEQDRQKYLDQSPEGIPQSVLPLDDDAEFKALEAERLDLIAKDPKANKDAIAKLEDAINERARDIAREQRKKDRAFLDPDPEGVPLTVLPLDTDRQFADLEAKRAALKAKDPVRNAAAIREVEDQLNDRAHQLAQEQIAEDLRAVDPNPEGIPVGMLHPHEDPEFARMVNALRALKADPSADPAKIKALEADMNDRVHELAEMALKDDRPQYLDANPEGIPVESLPLDQDPLFHQMEVERAKLKLEDPKKNQSKIADLEERLNDRAHELAKEQLARDLKDLEEAPLGIPRELLQPHKDGTFSSLATQRRDPQNKSRNLDDPTKELMNERLEALAHEMLAGDRDKYLEPNPEGVPLRALPLDNDPVFHNMEVERAILKAKDPKKNQAQITDLEDRLNERARELAREALKGDRGYLNQDPEGVPLDVLPLDTDPIFHQMETERARLKAQDPRKNQAKIAELEGKLNDRAEELAKKQLKEDLAGLDPNPHGIPLESLNPHDDEEFASYLPELRKLKQDPQKNAAKINDLQAKMNNRAHELAREKIAKDRAFLDPEPEGIPLAQLGLDEDKPFTDLERQLRQAKRDPKRNADKIADLQKKMNDRAHELARDKIQGDRGYLDADPEGVPLADVPIDNDPQFRQMEAERAKLKEDPKKNAEAIGRLEQQLNNRAHELAAEQKKADRAFLNPSSADIPTELLPLDSDAKFQKMEQQLRRLKKDPRRNKQAIENLQDMMQDRADELGEMMLKGDRDKYLDAKPEGVDLADLPLDSDPQFHQMEVERAMLKAKDPRANADRIAELEKALNDRAHDLAKEMRQNDRAFLDPEPEGIPIIDVPLDDDPNFLRMEDYLRKLKKDPRRNAAPIQEAQEKMNDRAHELAKGVVAADLACLPHAAYRGIPKEDLNLHSYPKFRDAANRRRAAIRKRRPQPEVAMIEDEMDGIAREIADDVIDNERAFLDPEPEGMDIHDLPLDTDPEFAALEAERRRRAKDPRSAKRNKDLIRDLEDKMNERAHQMAKDAFAKMRDFMDQEPEGVPLSKLPLDTDPEFKDAEIARYKLKKQPNADPKKIAELEKRMNDRAHELAKKELERDRAFLDPEPEGVPLSALPLKSDPVFQELAKQRQALKNAGRSRDPEMKELEAKMNDRAHALADEYLAKNRDYLDQEPQNVPLSDIPLNRDPMFRDLERELMKAKQDPKANADRIAQLQEDLNNRADELAKDMLRKERAAQDQEPLGVPLEELPLNFDPILNQLERKRRDLKKDPKKNAEALKKLEGEIADRVNDIARDYLQKERAFLDQTPEGVPLDRLPLNEDREFHDMEKELRALRKQPAKNKAAIEDLEERMNDRVHQLAKEQLAKDRGFLDQEPLGVPLDQLPLNADPEYRALEEQRRELKKDPRANAKAIKEVEDKMNDRVGELAEQKLNEDRAFLDPRPEGILLKDLPLNKDKQFQQMEKQLRELKKDPRRNAQAIKELQDDMNDRAHVLAKRQLADDRNYLNPEPRGVLLADLDLDNDPEFRRLELERREAKKDPVKNADTIRDLEEKLNDRADQVADDFLRKERAYLDPEPEGVPLEELPLDEDPDFHGMEVDHRKLQKDPTRNADAIKDLQSRLNDRAHELAKEKKGYQDPEFHESNEYIAEQWPRIRELYPEGVYEPVTPAETLPTDVISAPNDNGFLAPFIAALARHTVLISRLFQDKAHPQNQPYRITLFNPDSSPVTVEVDDRVPCDENREPKFTRVPWHSWYPLLLEKAYAKFVGGYENFNNCNAHDTLRDLTGRPVLHISFEDPKHAAVTNMSDYTTPAFWRRVIEDVTRGDVFVCVANSAVPNGIHAHCSYALMDVVEVVQGTNDPNDIIIKVHNCYRDEPVYNGPLRKGDSSWTAEAKRACDYDPSEQDMIYMPLPTFLDNFSCMQRCHINCGDRLSSPGEWNDNTAGGTSKYTTFRSNPIYLVENKTSRPATILAEVRHSEPLYVDESGCKRYPYTGLSLMQPIDSKLPATPFITNSTHKTLQKGMMLDSREVCAEMVVPASSTCYLIPFTKDRGTMGRFNVSIYPDMAKVTLTPLRHAGLTLKPLHADLKLDVSNEEGTRLDFMVNDICDVHILLRQTKISDPNSVRRGDAVAEDDVMMAVFTEYGIKVDSTGDATNAREHALVFKTPQPGRYAVVVSCSGSSGSGPCPAYLEIYTPRDVEATFVPVPPDAKPLNLQAASRFPTLSRTATAPSASRAQSRERGLSKDRMNVRRTDSLPPVSQRSASARRVSKENPNTSTARRPSRGRR